MSDRPHQQAGRRRSGLIVGGVVLALIAVVWGIQAVPVESTTTGPATPDRSAPAQRPASADDDDTPPDRSPPVDDTRPDPSPAEHGLPDAHQVLILRGRIRVWQAGALALALIAFLVGIALGSAAREAQRHDPV